jgi:tetratricopeptide (TPR) repeat protein
MTPAFAPQSTPSANAQTGRTRLVLALVVLLLVAAPLVAFGVLAAQQRPRDAAAASAAMTMEAANALYASGQYDLAAQAYAQLVAQGHGGLALRYNLGVALLEAGDATAAVEALQTAQRAYPRDVTIRRTLVDAERLARGALALDTLDDVAAPDAPDAAAPIPLEPQLAAEAPGLLAEVRLQWLSTTEVALLALLLWALLAALLLVAYTAAPRSGRRRFAVAGAVLLAGALLFALALLTV